MLSLLPTEGGFYWQTIKRPRRTGGFFGFKRLLTEGIGFFAYMKKITGSQAVMESLLAEGVDVIFGYPGGAIMPVYDALYDYQNKIRHILVRHEQGSRSCCGGICKDDRKTRVWLLLPPDREQQILLQQ